MKNFIDLMIDIANNEELGQQCTDKLQEGDHVDLSAWFKSQGYDISEEDCKKLYDHKDIAGESSVQKWPY